MNKKCGPKYNPQVEAISPTLPSETLRDESPLRSTKEELLSQIARVDREIAKTESQIAKLKKKRFELEEAATQPEGYAEENSNASDSIIRSLPQSLYAENRKKAYQAHHTLEKLGPKVELPLYNQPSDTAPYHENKLKYTEIKIKLLDYIKIRFREKSQREAYLTTTYVKLSLDWSRKLEKLENSTRKRLKEAKNREIFEKIFPELRKQREDKERFSRVGSRIKSDADLEEIMDGLHEQELEDKKMRSYAVIPPILLDERTRKRRFANRNGLIEDPMQEYKDKQLLNVWTDQEKDIFKEKYLQHPKFFGIIKSYMERKNVSDCVQYYYLSKKAQNYRQLLRKNRARTRSTRNQQHNTNPGTTISTSGITTGFPIIKPETNGVTTRQQKELKLDNQTTSSNGGVTVNNLHEEMSIVDMENHPGGLSGTEDNVNSLEVDGNNLSMQFPQSTGQQNDFSPQVKKKRKDESKDLHTEEMDTSEEDIIVFNSDKGVSHPHHCAICKDRLDSYLNSRPLFRTQATQYGLNEEDIHSGDRVCTSCRCKSVRRRYKPSHCPIPTCPTGRARTKRLRPFPSKWSELSGEIKDAICAKYQIPVRVTKCCTACFNRISRRLNPNTSLDTPDDPGSDTTCWTQEEIDAIKRALTEIGTDWKQLSERVVTKSDLQCRNFYFNFRKNYGLDILVQDFKKSKGVVDGPPILTDEEESGSTTSSCDEGAHHSHNQSHTSLDRKDEYDSSATVSAEEGGIEMEKPRSETPKTLPTHPDSTLQHTILSCNSLDPSSVDSDQSKIRIIKTNSSHSTHLQPGSGHLGPRGPYQSNITSRESHHHTASPHGSQQVMISHQMSMGNSSLSPHPNIQQQHHITNPVHSTQTNTSQVPVVSQTGPTVGFHHVHQTPPSITSTHSGMRYPNADNVESSEQMTVKDLMLATIEIQLRRNPASSTGQNQSLGQTGGQPNPSVSPTITSILKSQDRTHLIPQSQQHIPSNPQIQNSGMQSQSPNIQTPQQSLYHSHPLYYGSKMEVRGVFPHVLVTREGLPVHQVSRDEYETLDLSMKKRTPSPQIVQQRPPSSGPPPAHQPLDYVTRQEVYYPKYSPLSRTHISHSTLNKIPAKLPPPPLLTKPPSTSPGKDGSITHGTPVHVSQTIPSKYEGLLRPMKEGSIIQGTPLDKIRTKDSIPSPYIYVSGRQAEYYKVMPSSYYHSSPLQNFPHAQRSLPTRQISPSTTPILPYPAEQHNTSRQSIINDYYTSQQMQQPPASSMQQHLSPPNLRIETSKQIVTPGTSSTHAVCLLPQRLEVTSRQSSPLNLQPHNQQRQGVIHRTSINRPLVKTDTGRFQQHDAFYSLVDIAAAQPSLPVPNEEIRPRMVGIPRVDMVKEGLGKSIAEMERNRMNLSELRPSPQLFRGAPLPASLNNPEDPLRSRKQVENKFNRDLQDSTVTAATLIDAIITRQINQPTTQDRHSPVPTTRTGDRLFASFQRSVQIPTTTQHSIVNSQPIPPMRVQQQQLEETKLEDSSTQSSGGGRTWGDHIDLIISKDYASSKGTRLNPEHKKGSLQMVTPLTSPSSDSTKQEDVGPYINWKLRRALQYEREQLENKNHLDERHIIRVIQNEQHSKPISGNSNLSTGESGSDIKELSTSTTVSSIGSVDVFTRSGGREGIISPLDYVKNRIVEVMRTGNQEDKSEDTSCVISEQIIPTSGSLTVGTSSLSTQNVLSSSSSSSTTAGQITEPCSSTFGQGGETTHSTVSNGALNITYDSSNYSNNTQGERKNSSGTTTTDKVTEADSPSSMVIDESEEGKILSSREQASSTTSNNPNYEPLTDEEN